MAEDIKLVFFDMEGTIFRKEVRDSKGNTAPSAWTVIAEELGEEALEEEEKTKEKWNNGEYNGYVKWMEDTIRIHQKYGLKKEQFERIITSVEYRDGVHETFESLRKNGVMTALVTGGFKRQADRAQSELGIDRVFAACEYDWDEETGEIQDWELKSADYQGKVTFMEWMMTKHRLKPNECAFVGDGSNDVHLAREVGLSVSYNGSPDLKGVTDYAIDQSHDSEDFSEVLKYLI